MIKKLNKHRTLRGGMWPKWYKDSSEYTKLSFHVWDIYFMLRELESRLEFSALRLKHAIRFHKSKQKRAELRFQQRILNEHLNQINQLLKKNDGLRKWAFEKEHGVSRFDFDSCD